MILGTFYSSKSRLVAWAVWATSLLLSTLLVWNWFSGDSWVVVVPLSIFCLLTIGYLLWTWFSTYYRVVGDSLFYRCGPFHGQIPINQIKKLSFDHYLWAGLRPALGFKGLVVHYNRWDEIYISPADREEFCRVLQKVNPDIEVEQA